MDHGDDAVHRDPKVGEGSGGGGAGAEGDAGDGAGDESGRRMVTAFVVGAGSRGKTYSQYAIEHPGRFKIVGVAEPRDFHRRYMAERYSIPEDRQFKVWQDAAELPRFADVVIIATQDAYHCEPACVFADLGYHLLLEKPMAPTIEECKMIVAAAKRNGVMLAVAHVLRYTPYMAKIKELIKDGVIGDIVNVQHLEPVGHWHFAHSYVRGKWSRKEDSTFMLMAKCCHDIDLIRYIVDERCECVSSLGSLNHFKAEKRPEGAGTRCLDCAIENTCPYSAKRVYLEPARSGYTGWPVSVIVDGSVSPDSIEEALSTGPYGRCVYDCDNDVNDHQVVSMQFSGGKSATLTVVAFSKAMCVRHTRIFGTLGELDGNGEDTIRVVRFGTDTDEEVHVDPAAPESLLQGHGGADFHLIDRFVQAVATNNPSVILSGPDDTLESHLMVFAAEQARLERRVVDLSELVPDEEEGIGSRAAAETIGAPDAEMS